jgi:hypothetical protein
MFSTASGADSLTKTPTHSTPSGSRSTIRRAASGEMRRGLRA